VTHDQEEAMTLADRMAVMHRGVVMQIGGPLDIYRRPANRFVAGFFGSPTMNFVDGKIERVDGKTGGTWFVATDDVRVAIPERDVEAIESRVGERATMGIRPEHVEVSAGADRSSSIQMRVSLVEQLGDRVIVHGVTKSGVRMVGRAAPTMDVRIGEGVAARIEANQLHLFEADGSGTRLC